MSIININRENFESEVMASEKPVILDFWASWCGPCKSVAPVLDEIAEEHPELKVCKVNVEDERDLAKQFRVMSIPTFLIVKNGEVVNRAMGAMPKHQILDLL